jgi:alpha-glucosidase (family GH31 glycosyl hydrolase)
VIHGVSHSPTGHDDLYSTEPTERFPRDPMAGDTVFLNVSTFPIEPAQTVWITWSKNGTAQPPAGGTWQRNAGDRSYWTVQFGPFDRGDEISYTVHANEAGSNEKIRGPFTFHVTSWSNPTKVTAVADNHTSVDVTLDDSAGDYAPVLRLSFPMPDCLHVQFGPSGKGLAAGEAGAYQLTQDAATVNVSTTGLTVRITREPFRMALYAADGQTLITEQYDPALFRNLGWASDGKNTLTRIEDHLVTSPAEVFSGFGERYDFTNLYGHDVNIFIVNEYGDQAATDRTYLAAPCYLNSAGYGFFSPSTATSVFNIGTFRPDMTGFTITTDGSADSILEYYLFTGTPEHILDRYTVISGRPELPPKWAFGLWVSANEWNSEAMVNATLDAADANGVPVSVLVLEQWADEATFYVWHGAQYTPTSGDAFLNYADFTFAPEWPDPKAMVANVHGRGVRMVLWQIPAFKEIFSSPTPHYPTQAPPQLLTDKEYAAQQHYVAASGGAPYRTPLHSWFGNSMVPDFTDPAAVQWWNAKRGYLVTEVGIDGFKCDGGEMIYGRGTTFADGRTGTTMHNGYPATYLRAYAKLLAATLGTDYVLFSRAGTAGAQALSLYWAGDQLSTFDSFAAAIRAGLSAAASGIPFWGWDLAGFAGPEPGSELYQRATAMSAFAPVMQLHSQWARPPDSAERTPWHVAQVDGDPSVIATFRTYACVRMNLLPYLYSEAKRTSTTGAPLMRPMGAEFPADQQAVAQQTQYMLGPNLLVAPVITAGASMVELYVPAGEWHDLWNSAAWGGPRMKQYGVPVSAIPVYARPGAIIPLNLNADYQLGGPIGNSTANDQLTIRVYPEGASSYDYYDDAAGSVVVISAQATWTAHMVSVALPVLSEAVTVQIMASAPPAVTVNGVPLPGQPTLAALQAAPQGWWWDPLLQATLVKLGTAAAGRVVTLTGVDKLAYEAEFAIGTGTTTNTNHAGATGGAFVDSFDAAGKSVTFFVLAEDTVPYDLVFRYANADGVPASRTVYVDGSRIGQLSLPALPDWDSWGTAAVQATLHRGTHQVTISYDDDDSQAINLDNLSLVQSAAAAAPVATQHNDVGRTGANQAETALTPDTVSPARFAKLFSYPVDGFVFAQPLYAPAVAIPGQGVHNVVFVATMSNNVYAFDADDPLQASVPLWHRTLEPPIPLPDANIGPTFIDPATKKDTGLATKPDGTPVYGDIAEQVGVLSTPVLAPDSRVLYLVTACKDPAAAGAAAYSHHLHALDMATGADLDGSPAVVAATAPGAGYTGLHGEQETVAAGQISFTSHRQLQRAGLLLLDGTLYIAFAAYGDKDCYHGWVLGYDASTLQQTAAIVTTPSGQTGTDRRDVGRGGIWQAGAGLASDGTSIYASTGNGGFANGTDFADCYIRLDPSTLAVLDWFTPFNQQLLADHDIDVGSSGVLVVPGTNLLAGGGKESKMFLLDRSDMGKYDPAAGNAQIVEHFYIHAPANLADPIGSAAKYDGTGHHLHGSPVFGQGADGPYIYAWVEDDVVKAFQLLPSGKVAATPLAVTGIPGAQLGVPASQGAATGLAGISGISPGMPGGALSLSSNAGTAGTGILWASHPLANANEAVVPGVLRAYDAGDLSRELWNSRMHAARDDIGRYAKFSAPTIATGRVYLATFSNQVLVYGLL